MTDFYDPALSGTSEVCCPIFIFLLMKEMLKYETGGTSGCKRFLVVLQKLDNFLKN
jgi:hypothetical protein